MKLQSLLPANRDRFLNILQGYKMPIGLQAVSVAKNYEYVAKRWLSPDDLKNEYGFSKSTQAKMRMTKNGSTIPFSKINGKYIRYDRFAIDTWLENHRIAIL